MPGLVPGIHGFAFSSSVQVVDGRETPGHDDIAGLEVPMARWIALFDDNPDAAWVRRNHAQAHVDYLAAHAGRIVIGGGLRPEPDAWWEGGLWVMKVETREEAVRLVEADPYFTLGLRKSYRLAVWGKAPCYGEVRL